jgi:hypothetical protein
LWIPSSSGVEAVISSGATRRGGSHFTAILGHTGYHNLSPLFHGMNLGPDVHRQ